MSVHIHCELCGQAQPSTAQVAVVSLPPKDRPMASNGLFPFLQERINEEHHLCPPCGRALWSLVEVMRRDGTTLTR